MNSSELGKPVVPASSGKIDLKVVGLTVIPHIMAILTELVITGKVNFRSNSRDKLIIGQVLQALVDEFKRVQGIDINDRI